MKNLLVFGMLLAACSSTSPQDALLQGAEVIGPSHACDTAQIFGRADHGGAPVCAPLTRLSVIDQTVIDPSFDDELFNDGLFVHYMQPLTNGPFKYEGVKRGFSDIDNQVDQTWSVQAKQHVGAANVVAWTFDSSWKPLDAINPFSWTNAFEQLFQAVSTVQGVYIPMSAGQLALVDSRTGALIRTINPLAGTLFDGDPLALVNSALSADKFGNVYYTVVAWPAGAVAGDPLRGSWLVRVAPSGAATILPWSAVALTSQGVFAAEAQCTLLFSQLDPTFSTAPFPAPDPDSAAPTGHCGEQFPTVNAAPAIGPDGSVYVLSQGNNALRSEFLIKLSSALVPMWASPIVDIAQDGCGINLPFDNTNSFACREGAKLGIDPETALLPADMAAGIMQIAPVVAPDGSIYVSTYTSNYDNNQGHLVRFSAAGKRMQSFPFGFMTMPLIQRTGASNTDFRVVINSNLFSSVTGDGEGADGTYRTAVLDANLNTLTSFTVVQDPNALANDFVDGQAAVDSAGNSYHMDAQGTLYMLDKDSQVVGTLQLADSTEPVSAEMSWGTDGNGRSILLVTFAGVTYEIGTSGGNGQPQPHTTNRVRSRHRLRAAVTAPHVTR